MNVKKGLSGSILALALACVADAQQGVNGASDSESAVQAGDIREPEATDACVNSRDIDDFEALTDEFVHVETRRNEHFLITVFPGCYGLENSIAIAISNDFNRVCSNDRARIQYREFGRLRACRIDKVQQVESREAAQRIVELFSGR